MSIDVIKELKNILSDDGWTQKSLAEKLNISPQYLSDILRGNRNPGKKVLNGLNIEKVILYRYKDGCDGQIKGIKKQT